MNRLTWHRNPHSTPLDGTYVPVREAEGALVYVRIVCHRGHTSRVELSAIHVDGTIRSGAACHCDLGADVRLNNWSQAKE